MKKKPVLGWAEPSESQSQQAVIKWWSYAHGKWPERLLMAIPNQGARNARNGARMKAEGLRPGTPDLFLAVPVYNKWLGGLWIEMKTKTGVVRPNQREFHRDLDDSGYVVAVCRSSEEAIDVISNYLKYREEAKNQ